MVSHSAQERTRQRLPEVPSVFIGRFGEGEALPRHYLDFLLLSAESQECVLRYLIASAFLALCCFASWASQL